MCFRTIRVWLKRDSGTYWPSIVNFMPSQCSAIGNKRVNLIIFCMTHVITFFYFIIIEYVPETRTMYVGQENGTISQFLLSEDCNRLTPIKEYLAHNGKFLSNLLSLTSYIMSSFLCRSNHIT